MSIPKSSALSMMQRPLGAALDSIFSRELDVFFALGVVNPLGPTLTLVAAPRQGTLSDGSVPVYRVLLNPFEQRVARVGTINPGETCLSVESLDPLLRMDLGICPTLILIDRRFTPEERSQLTGRILEKFPGDVARVCVRVRAFFGNPWDRITAEMRGEEPLERRPDLSSAIRVLAEMQSLASHVISEIDAFFAAWRGSIVESGIPASMAKSALPLEAIRNFWLNGVVPSVWIPVDQSVEPGQFKFDAQATRTELHAKKWRTLEGETLLHFALRALVMYGSDKSSCDISQLMMMYRRVIKHCSVSMRLELVSRIERVVRNDSVSAIAFLPIVIAEEAEWVTATATIELVSYSRCIDGKPEVLGVLHPLMGEAIIVNRGAVIGALISMGEATLMPHVDEMRTGLVCKELAVAARIDTKVVQHHAVQYWLRWAESVVDSRDIENEGIFGVCASALLRLGRKNPDGKVSENARHFPTVERLNVWSAEEYAIDIAPVLYRLESRERPPKVMPHVLTAWGLTPKTQPVDCAVPPDEAVPVPDTPA